MVSSVRSLSNHYDTLRIRPTASSDQISEAFAKQIKSARVRPDITVAQLAQISVAYETLRDPVRRRAYDASLGLNAEAQPRPAVAPEPRVASFIAASLRDPVKPRETETRPQPDPVPEQWPVPKAIAPAAAPEQPAPRAEIPPRPRIELMLEPREEASPISIDRKQAIVGAGFAGLAILAIALAAPQKQAAAPELTTNAPPAQAVTVGLPPATPARDQSALPVQMPATAVATAQPVPQPDNRNATTTGAPDASSDQAQATQLAADQPTPTESASQQTAAATTQSPAVATPAETTTDSTVTATPAKLPLAEATIARTIERIGYSCGSIVSSSAVSPGVFKIVCSSGDSYQASPIRGRYRFHRLGSH